MYPKKFDDLIYEFQKLPGVGRKTAERYAFNILERNKEDVEAFSDTLKKVKTDIKTCEICGNICENDKCEICTDMNRNHKIICVVENTKNIIAIEAMHEYNGVYHVLNGLINTTKGILPDQLNIESLMKRIDDGVEEVILALDPTIEGETTSLYLIKLLSPHCKVTRLAYGIPIGSHLDYTDALTLSKAFEGRK